MRSRRSKIAILIISITFMMQIASFSSGMEWDGTYNNSNARPWKIWYRDPHNIQSMEMDQENRTLYIGCEYGLIIKNLDTEEYDLIDRFDGLNPTVNPLVMDIELDLPNERLFFVLEGGPEVYEFDIRNREISTVHSFDAFATMLKWGRSKALEYDISHDILYFARDSGLLVFDMNENVYRFFDFLNFEVELSDYSLLEDGVEVVMRGYEREFMEDIQKWVSLSDCGNLFAISDIELGLDGERLFIATNSGLFTYYRTTGNIVQNMNRTKIGRPLQDLLFLPDLSRLILTGEKVWSMDLDSNETIIIYEDSMEREYGEDDFLKVEWDDPRSSLIISSGKGPALIFYNWNTGNVTYSINDYMKVENARVKHWGWDMVVGNFTEMIIDEQTGYLLLSMGDMLRGGYVWKVRYTINGNISSERFDNQTGFIEITSYSVHQEIHVDEKLSEDRSFRRSMAGSLLTMNIENRLTKSITILDYISLDNYLYSGYYNEQKNLLAATDGSLFINVMGSLWEVDIEDRSILQETFAYYNETKETYPQKRILNIFNSDRGILASTTNGTYIYTIENGTREFNETLVIPGNNLGVGPVSGHIFATSSNRTELIEYDPLTGESQRHHINVTDPRTGEAGPIKNLCFNSDETMALVGTFRNLTLIDLKDWSIGKNNLLGGIRETNRPICFVETMYHEGMDTFIGITEHSEAFDLMSGKSLGDISSSSLADHVMDHERELIFSVSGNVWHSWAYSSEGPNGLVSFDPESGDIVEYYDDIGLPRWDCMGLTIDRERDMIFIVGTSFIAGIRFEDLERNWSSSEITTNLVRSDTYPVPGETLGMTPSDHIAFYENKYVIGGAGIGGFAILALVVVFIEPLKFKLLSAFTYPLYTKVRENNLLDNKRRREIIGVIREHPYIHFNGIRDKLSLGPGETVYHLRVLEREELINSESRGTRKVFYIRGRENKRDEFLHSKLQRMIVEQISHEPGISQRELSRRLDTNPSTINYNVRALARRDIIRIDGSSSRSRCYRSN